MLHISPPDAVAPELKGDIARIATNDPSLPDKDGRVIWWHHSLDWCTPALLSALAEALPMNTCVRAVYLPDHAPSGRILRGSVLEDMYYRDRPQEECPDAEFFARFELPEFDAALQRLAAGIPCSAIEQLDLPYNACRYLTGAAKTRRERIDLSLDAVCFCNRLPRDLRRVARNDPALRALSWPKEFDSLAVRALAAALRTNTHVFSLWLHHSVEMDQDDEELLADALPHSGVCICVSSSQLLFTTAFLQLCRRVAADDPAIDEIDIGGNFVRDSDVLKLAECLRCNTHVRRLLLSECSEVGDVSAEALLNVIPSCGLEFVDLEETGVESLKMVKIWDAVQENLFRRIRADAPDLVKVDWLSGYITDGTLASLGDALRTNTHVRELEMSYPYSRKHWSPFPQGRSEVTVAGLDTLRKLLPLSPIEIWSYEGSNPLAIFENGDVDADLFEDEMQAICRRTADIATVRPRQRLLLGTLYGRGQDHPRPLVQAPLPLDNDVMEVVLGHLAASRACPGHLGLDDATGWRMEQDDSDYSEEESQESEDFESEEEVGEARAQKQLLTREQRRRLQQEEAAKAAKLLEEDAGNGGAPATAEAAGRRPKRARFEGTYSK